MSVSVGDVVKFANATGKADLGRVCKDNGITVCVHFRHGGCVRVAKAALEAASGAAPDCTDECTGGC